MKKLFLFAGLAVMAALTACDKNEIAVSESIKAERTISLIATLDETKTEMDGPNINWSDRDSLSVFLSSGMDVTGAPSYGDNIKFTVVDAAAGIFTGSANLTEQAYDWYVFYPYVKQLTTPNPSLDQNGYTYIGARSDKTQVQAAYDDKAHLAGKNAPLFGHAKNVSAGSRPNIQMHQVAAAVAMKVTNGTDAPISILEADFTAPEGQPIVGSFYIDFSGDLPAFTPSYGKDQTPYTTNVARVTLTESPELAVGESATIYALMTPFTAPAGSELKLTVSTDKGSQEKVIVLNEDVTFSNGYIRALNFTYDAEPDPIVIWDLTAASYAQASESSVWWVSDYAVMTAEKSQAQTNANNYLGGDGAGHTSTRFYKNSVLTFTPASGFAITSVEYTATTAGYATALANSAWTNAAAEVEGTTVTITPVDGFSAFSATIGGTTGASKVVLYYMDASDKPALETPVIELAAARTATSIYVQWTAVANAKYYSVVLNPEAGGDTIFVDVDAPERTCLVENLPYSTEYTIWVIAYPEDEDKYRPSEASASTKVTTGEDPNPTYDFTTVAELNALATTTATEHSGMLTGAVVSFVPDTKNAVIKDATGSILLYKNGHGLVQGQTLTGALSGSLKLYNGFAELTSLTANFTGNGAVVAPEDITVAAINAEPLVHQNAYVQVKDLKVSAIDGKNITVTSGNDQIIVYDSTGSVNLEVGNDIEVTGTVSQYNSVLQIKVWSAADIVVGGVVLPTCETPVFNPNGGEVNVDDEVEISCATQGAAIHYTTDGSTPTANSTLYEYPIAITKSMTIKAIAVKENYNPSAVASATFTVAAQGTSTIAQVLAAGEGTYNINNLLVYHVNGNNVIVGDNTGKMLLYKSGHGLTAGDNISLADATVALYQNSYLDITGWTTLTTNSTGNQIDFGSITDLDDSATATATISSFTEAGFHAGAILVSMSGSQSNRYITGKNAVLYMNLADNTYNGKNVRVKGFIYCYSTQYSNFNFHAVQIQEDTTSPSLTVSPESLSWTASDVTAKTITVTVNEGASYSISGTNNDWTVTDNKGTITVAPKAANTDTENAKVMTLTITHLGDKSITKQVVCTQAKSSGGTVDYSTVMTSNVAIAGGENGSAVKVVVDAESAEEFDAIKVGTSKKGGNMTITVPSGAKKLYLHAAAWKGVSNLSVTITGATVSPESIAPTADDGITGSATTFTLSGDATTMCFELALTDITADTVLTLAADKRFVVWGANAE